jgi:hypothetical protein
MRVTPLARSRPGASVDGRVVRRTVQETPRTNPDPVTPMGTTAHRYGAGEDHTHAGSRHTQLSWLLAGLVRAPQVGHAVGAPSLISWVASAESWADPRRGRRAGMFFGVIVSPWFQRGAARSVHRGWTCPGPRSFARVRSPHSVVAPALGSVSLAPFSPVRARSPLRSDPDAKGESVRELWRSTVVFGVRY